MGRSRRAALRCASSATARQPSHPLSRIWPGGRIDIDRRHRQSQPQPHAQLRRALRLWRPRDHRARYPAVASRPLRHARTDGHPTLREPSQRARRRAGGEPEWPAVHGHPPALERPLCNVLGAIHRGRAATPRHLPWEHDAAAADGQLQPRWHRHALPLQVQVEQRRD